MQHFSGLSAPSAHDKFPVLVERPVFPALEGLSPISDNHCLINRKRNPRIEVRKKADIAKNRFT
jgi:hypothetical protein